MATAAKPMATVVARAMECSMSLLLARRARRPRLRYEGIDATGYRPRDLFGARQRGRGAPLAFRLVAVGEDTEVLCDVGIVVDAKAPAHPIDVVHTAVEEV